ncbi:hypothetical protein ROHU_026393 [Labeo rohita]|uniref:Uncharacterized protein n=1 Tax=Labeo rohita TaxID=84645 RepID=A0A498MAY4_LABRO|nr:hypothetical protein ROHU_026393 [Labeo rohita]
MVIANEERQEQRRWIPVGLTSDHGLQSPEMSAVEDHCLLEPDNQTQKSWRPDRPIIRLKAKRGHLDSEEAGQKAAGEDTEWNKSRKMSWKHTGGDRLSGSDLFHCCSVYTLKSSAVSL